MSDVTDKIRKLIAKAQSTTNPNEAAAFMNKATEMMAANGLSMEAVDLSAIKEAKVKSRFSVSKPKDYEITLMSSVAVSFGCELMWQPNRSENRLWGESNYAEVIFVGPKDRLELATYAADVLGRQLAKARSTYSNERSAYYWGVAARGGDYTVEEAKMDPDLRRMIAPRVTKEANSFAIGWVMEIRKKVTRFALNDKEQALIAQYVNNKADPDGKCEAKKSETDMASYLKGLEAAKDAHLHRPVGSTVGEQSLLGQTLQIGNK
jgi:hypothetical protein